MSGTGVSGPSASVWCYPTSEDSLDKVDFGMATSLLGRFLLSGRCRT